ncbi:hypothetical protein JXB22_06610 [candidate division WOR-3 bacterium]|nr:hypothetical protein [candidate division WOR-3 bacterium]
MYKFFLLVSMCCLMFVACGSDTEPPTVEMYYPHDGDTVWATVYITAKALDNDTIQYVEFFINDSLVGDDEIIVQDSLFQWMWMTYSTGDTTYKSLHAIAYDGNENSTTSNTITVYVDNEGHPPGGD